MDCPKVLKSSATKLAAVAESIVMASGKEVSTDKITIIKDAVELLIKGEDCGKKEADAYKDFLYYVLDSVVDTYIRTVKLNEDGSGPIVNDYDMLFAASFLDSSRILLQRVEQYKYENISP
ncbi:hypothetical protein pCXcHC2016_17 [Xenohaliotis phage pCXc-HC2016]|nr:hypothetical protein pCXcHC2016_17 [Xenohaliotis phage pCXc-HC2016]AQW89124.1 hypothetical protein pCXcHR2015_17 [Xenohaliotis phage pCXc-HR2015]